MFKVMLDTCILIDFSLIYTKEDKNKEIPDRLKHSKELLIQFEESKFQNVMNLWNKWEIRKVLMEIRLE